VLAPGSVERVQGGYKVNTGWWPGYDPFFVEWERALPFSPDGNYRICITQDESLIPTIRCFIAPPEFRMIANRATVQFSVAHQRAYVGAPATSQYSPRSAAPHPSSAAWPLIAAPAHPQNSIRQLLPGARPLR